MSSFPTLPEQGDVLIQPGADPSGLYHVGIVSGGLQLVCATYDEAVWRASLLAQKGRVNTWYTEDHIEFRLMSSFRRVA